VLGIEGVEGRASVECDALVLATHDASLAADAVRSIGTAGATDADAAASEQRSLAALGDSLAAQRAERTVPAFTWSGMLPRGASADIPFDMAVAAASPLISLLARDASKPGQSRDLSLRPSRDLSLRPLQAWPIT
jgi:hypothetical protein